MIQSILYLVFIVLSDVLAAKWIIPIGFGLIVPAGVFAIAPIFTLRDGLHRQYGAKFVTGLIFLASLLSYIASVIFGNALLGKITIASVLAFLVSENADTIVYHLTENQPWINRVIKSNLVSTALDSFIFITLSFGFIFPLILGQYIVKMIIAGGVGFIYKNKHI